MLAGEREDASTDSACQNREPFNSEGQVPGDLWRCGARAGSKLDRPARIGGYLHALGDVNSV